MLPLQEILNKYNVHPKGVIHVGAHWAEEHEDYVKCGIERYIYIEPCKEAFDVLWNKMKLTAWATCLNFACGATEEKMVMHVSHNNQGQSNSLLAPSLHIEQHPEIVFNDAEVVEVIPLDKLKIENFDFLVMDCQGYEGEVLKGATETLKHIDIVYSEINRGQTYAGNVEIEEMDELLDKNGFVRVETHWPSPNWTWGDAIFLRKTLINA